VKYLHLVVVSIVLSNMYAQEASVTPDLNVVERTLHGYAEKNQVHDLEDEDMQPRKMKLAVNSEDSLDKKLARMYQDEELLCKSVTLQSNQVEVGTLFEIIGKAIGINFMVDPRIKGTVKMLNIKDMRASDALALAVDNAQPQAALIKLNNVWHITTREEAKKILRQELGDVYEHKALSIGHARMDKEFEEKVEREWKNLVKDAPDSYLHFDAENKKIFVCSKQRQVKAFYQYLKEIDKPILQVRIDLIIVMASKEFFMDFGIDWSGIYNRENTIKTTGKNFGFYGLGGTLLDFPNPGTTPDAKVPKPPNTNNPNLFVNPLDFAINLFDSGLSFLSSTLRDRATAGLIRLPFVFGGPDLSLRRLNLVLNMAEVEEKINIVSRPSILTSNNKIAKILLGQSLPMQQTITDAGTVERRLTTVNYKDTGIVMEVLPLVSPDKKSVYLDILVQESLVVSGSTRSNEQGIMLDPPVLSVVKTKNEVVLKDGQTTIIGGLSTRESKKTQRSVPFFSRIPIIGELFKATFETQADKERYIFITPKIVECEV
jgi:type IV pilus assembly protein PilQ